MIDCLHNGQKLVLLVDEMPSPDRVHEWREMYDPEIEHLIGTSSYGNQYPPPFPLQLWRPLELADKDTLVKLGVIDTSDLAEADEGREEEIENRYA